MAAFFPDGGTATNYTVMQVSSHATGCSQTICPINQNVIPIVLILL